MKDKEESLDIFLVRIEGLVAKDNDSGRIRKSRRIYSL